MTPEVRVATGPQAELLLDVRLRPLLTVLMQGPVTVSQVAGQLGLSLNRAHYLVTKLVRARIAVVERTQARSGRPVKHYVTFPRWFIPFDVTSADTIEESADAQMLPRIQQIVRHALHVIQQQPGVQRGYWLTDTALTIGDEHGPLDELFFGSEPFMLAIGQVRLSRQHAAQLKERLSEVMREFAALEDPAEAAYATGIMLVRGPVI